jgi:hypothetical protein
MTSEDDKKVVKAANLFRLVPASSTLFSYADVLVHVGVASDVARTETYRKKFSYQMVCILQQDGPPRLNNSDYGKVKHAKDIMHPLPKLLKANLSKLAGWTNQDLYAPLHKKGPSKLYMQVQRAKAKLNKEGCNNPAAPAHCAHQMPPTRPPSAGPPPIETPSVIAVHFDSRETAAVDLLSPLSAASDASSTGPLPSSVASRSTASSNTRLRATSGGRTIKQQEICVQIGNISIQAGQRWGKFVKEVPECRQYCYRNKRLVWHPGSLGQTNC